MKKNDNKDNSGNIRYRKIVFSITVILLVFYFMYAIAGLRHQGIESFSDEIYVETLEEAFRNSPASQQEMGEILFIDVHEGSVTVFHRVEEMGMIYVSHYSKREESESNLYFCRRVQRGTDSAPLSFTEFSIYAQKNFIYLNISSHQNRENVVIDSTINLNNRFYEALGRRPLHGVSFDERVHGLMINGYPVETVIEAYYDGRKWFFWYFSDFPAFYGTVDEITITFE